MKAPARQLLELPAATQWLEAVELADALLRQGEAGGVLAFDGEFRYVYFSPAMEELSGMRAADVVGRSAFEVFPFLSAIGEQEYFQTALEGRACVSRDRAYWIPETRREGVFDAHYVPLRAPDGSVAGVVALIRETSERKRVAAQVRESEQRFRIMADVSPVLLWMARADGMCTFFNQTWIDFTGRSQEEEWGVGWAEGVHFEDLQRALDTYTQAFSARERFEMEYRLRRADGEYRWVLDRGTPRYLPDGTFAGYIGSCVDITDRKRAEAELRRNIAAKDDFLGLVSHELRTPITALQLQIERLRRSIGTALSAREREMVTRIASTADRLAHLIEGVLHVCRIESGKLRLEPSTFDLARVAWAVLDEQRAAAERKGLQLSVRADAPLPALYSDPELVRLVLSNLVSNAVKFTERGQVEIVLSHQGSAHRVIVRDTGQGIPREQHARIFGVFERVESMRNKHTPGVGLGLALVKALTAALGGSVTLESEVGKGSAFTVELPQVSDRNDAARSS